jgi:hypothetical protein
MDQECNIKTNCNTMLQLNVADNTKFVLMNIETMDEYNCKIENNLNFKKINASINGVNGYSYECEIINDTILFVLKSEYDDDITLEFKHDKGNPNDKLIRRIISLEKRMKYLETQPFSEELPPKIKNGFIGTMLILLVTCGLAMRYQKYL